MPKLSSLDLSKLAQLKTKILQFFRSHEPLPLIIAGVAGVALITTFSLIIVYHGAPNSSDPATPDEIPNSPDDEPSASTPGSNHRGSEETPPGEEGKTPAFIDLQPTVNAWLKTTTASVGLMVYDLDNNRVAASYQADRVFNVASIYKLFFVYDGYRQIDTGAIAADAPYVTTSDYRAGTYTYGECLDLMVRESYNGCANKMRSDRQAFARVQTLIDELNLTKTTNGGLSSTAADLTELLKLFYRHSDLSDASWQKLADSMLNQPPTKVDATTTYNWRQGLPSGFSKQVNVYDKVGWAWDEDAKVWQTYADAAIVEFPSLDRHYAVVVLTSNLPGRNPVALASLGTRLEDAILANGSSL